MNEEFNEIAILDVVDVFHQSEPTWEDDIPMRRMSTSWLTISTTISIITCSPLTNTNHEQTNTSVCVKVTPAELSYPGPDRREDF